MGEILQRMESATNQSYVANSLYEKNKKTQPNLKLHESLNATHAKLKHSDYKGDAAKLATAEKLSVKSSHFYGRHGAQISKADQLARVGANVACERRVVHEMRLADGLPWSLPITLPVDRSVAGGLRIGQEVALLASDGSALGILHIADKFSYDKTA